MPSGYSDVATLNVEAALASQNDMSEGELKHARPHWRKVCCPNHVEKCRLSTDSNKPKRTACFSIALNEAVVHTCTPPHRKCPFEDLFHESFYFVVCENNASDVLMSPISMDSHFVLNNKI